MSLTNNWYNKKIHLLTDPQYFAINMFYPVCADQYVFCARDGWGTENVQGKSASLHIQAWVFNSKQFTRSFIMDKNNVDVTSPTTDTVPFDSTYSLDSMLVSVQVSFI